MSTLGPVTGTAKPKVTVGVCGGIAAYKAVELVRLLQDAEYDPHVVMTRAAEEFVRPLTFAAISGHRVITTLWGEEAGTGSGAKDASGEHSSVEHIEQAQTTRVLVVAPATADVLAKFAHGLADDFLSTLYLAMSAPVIVAPAMNVVMWEHAAVRANVETLRARGVVVVEPGSGYLACGMVGGGRLAELGEIVASVSGVLDSGEAHPSESMDGAPGTRRGGGRTQVSKSRPGAPGVLGEGRTYGSELRPGALGDARTHPSKSMGGAPGAVLGDFARETVLVTAGGTREAIDPVRFIGNRSSGRMGYAVAAAAKARGARVILVSAPSSVACPAGVEMVAVVSAEQMRVAVLERIESATVVVMAAAVSDYRVVEVAARKIKREANRAMTLELEATGDILGELVTRRAPGTLVVGFAAETENAIAHGLEKLARKGVDAVVVNDVSQPGIGFDGEENAGSFLTAEGVVHWPVMPKREMAERILDEVGRMRRGKG